MAEKKKIYPADAPAEAKMSTDLDFRCDPTSNTTDQARMPISVVCARVCVCVSTPVTKDFVVFH